MGRRATTSGLHLAFICEMYKLQVRGGRYCLRTHPHSADRPNQPFIVGFMDRFPNTFHAVPNSSFFFGPKGFTARDAWNAWREKADKMADEFWVHTSTLHTDRLAQPVPGDHEGHVPETAVRAACRPGNGAVATNGLIPTRAALNLHVTADLSSRVKKTSLVWKIPS